MTGQATIPSGLPRRMPTARIASPGAEVELVDADVPEPGSGEVLVRSHSVGICGSDLAMLAGTRPAAFTRYPVIPGHEWSGRVVAVGPGVDTIEQDTAVACMGLQWCGVCGHCRDGRVQLCERGYGEVGFTTPGGLAEYVVVRADQALPLPSTISLDEAALLEPTAVVCHAFLRCPPVTGHSVCVIGDGTLGLLAVQVARAGGAARVTMVGRDNTRLALARDLGADDVHTAGNSDVSVGPADKADVVLECAGAPGTALQAIDRARRGGTVAILGVTGRKAPMGVTADRFVVDDLTMTGVLASTPASWNHALRLAGSGQVRFAPLVTHRFGLDEVAAAFALAGARPPGTVKVLIEHVGEGVVS